MAFGVTSHELNGTVFRLMENAKQNENWENRFGLIGSHGKSLPAFGAACSRVRANAHRLARKLSERTKCEHIPPSFFLFTVGKRKRSENGVFPWLTRTYFRLTVWYRTLFCIIMPHRAFSLAANSIAYSSLALAQTVSSRRFSAFHSRCLSLQISFRSIDAIAAREKLAKLAVDIRNTYYIFCWKALTWLGCGRKVYTISSVLLSLFGW